MPVEWDASKTLRATRATVVQNMNKAALHVKGQVQRSINRGNADGSDPSLPGEPPKKVTARLFQSIATAVKTTPAEIIGQVGTNVLYARRLELGFTGTDADGRTTDQAPRPFLRPAIANNLATIARILRTGK